MYGEMDIGRNSEAEEGEGTLRTKVTRVELRCGGM